MKKTIIMILMLSFGLTAVSCVTKKERQKKAQELLKKRCMQCHFDDRIYKKSYTEEDWINIINRMIKISGDRGNEHKIPYKDAKEILILLQEESGE